MMKLPERQRSIALRAATLIGLTLLLSACGSDQSAGDASVLRQAVTQIFTKSPPPPTVNQAQIANARAQTDKSIILVSLPNLKSQALFVEIERNGSVVTYGTSSRQSISMENGVVRGTRGLGGDLMSTDHSLLRYAINTRRSTGGTRVLRYLDAASQTVKQNVSCSYQAGSVVVEKCVGEDGLELFSNTFQLSGSTVVESKQWISATLGYALISRIQ